MKMSLRCVLDRMKESFFVIGRFIRTLESKIYKHIIVVSQNIYINKLNEIVHKYNETCHERMNRKLAAVHSSTFSEYGVKHNDKDSNFRVDDCARIAKYIELLHLK